MINKTKIFQAIILFGLWSRTACSGKNTDGTFNQGFKSLLLIAV